MAGRLTVKEAAKAPKLQSIARTNRRSVSHEGKTNTHNLVILQTANAHTGHIARANTPIPRVKLRPCDSLEHVWSFLVGRSQGVHGTTW